MSDATTSVAPERLLQVAMRAKINRVSDSEEMRERVNARAKILAHKEAGLDNTQIRNLENIAYSTDKISDITDFLKQQIGRSKSKKRWRYQNVGTEILTDLLDKNRFLPRQIGQIITELTTEHPQAINDEANHRLRLDLYRAYIRHLTAEYLYQKVTEEDENASST
jgi:hypothetical protein